jgi:hypothetical protein
MSDFSETDALKLALDANSRKRGRQPAWLHAALQPREEAPREEAPRTEPEPARLSGQALIAALHGTTPEASDDDEPDDDLPAAA